MSGMTFRAGQRLVLDASAGIAAALDVIGDDADRRVPVDTGRLRSSQVRAVEGNTGGIGYTDSKAVGTHENLAVRYDRGREAKYLENAVNANRRRALELIADDLRRQFD